MLQPLYKVLYNPYMESHQIGNLLSRVLEGKLGNDFGFQILAYSPSTIVTANMKMLLINP